MTVQPQSSPAGGSGGSSPQASGAGEIARPADGVRVTIDGFEIVVPKGTLIIRAAEQLGIQIPRFCDHPLLAPVGACRQCLVQVEGQPKPPASCTTVCTEGMVVRTQLTSPVAEKAQRGVMELLLINHPLDCPMCDKGGECPLQNQAMSTGSGETRFSGPKRKFAKPIALSSQVLLDRERCVQCARCTRFADQIAGDPLIELIERGPQEQIAVAEGVPFDSYYSGNTVQICPVGALTGTAYRFRARPYDLVSTPSVCEHCASGCRQRTDHRRGVVTRRLAGSAPEVNEEWNCDKGRWAFTYATMPDRLVSPLVRNAAGVLQPASWSEALDAAARGLAAARGRAGVLTGGRLTLEDAYAYAKFARLALGSNDIDMRARPHSLRLRKAVRSGHTAVYSIAALASRGLIKLSGTLLPTLPGGEADALGRLTGPAGLAAASSGHDVFAAAAQALSKPGSVILAGERLAEVPGALTAAVALAELTGAGLAWIPRRAGERGAIEAGALPVLLPGGRRVTDANARTEVARVWGAASLPAEPGRDTGQILAAAARGEVEALVVAGVDPADLPDPAAALAALEKAGFIVSLELRVSPVTDRADVVLPVTAVSEKPGTFVNWEGRPGAFEAALSVPAIRGDLHVLAGIADAMDVHLGLPDEAAARRELAALGAGAPGVARSARTGQAASSQGPSGQAGAGSSLVRGPGRAEVGAGSAGTVPGAAEALLATWHNLLDAGRMQDGEPFLAGTARPAVAKMSAATAAAAGIAAGAKVSVSTSRGAIRVPVEIMAMPDRVVWLPTNSEGCSVRRDLGAGHGTLVTVRSAE